MESVGVRRNDFGIVSRANRFGLAPRSDCPALLTALPSSCSLPLWCFLVSTVGVGSFFVFDLMVVFYFAKRVLEKYLLRLPDRKGKGTSKAL